MITSALQARFGLYQIALLTILDRLTYQRNQLRSSPIPKRAQTLYVPGTQSFAQYS